MSRLNRIYSLCKPRPWVNHRLYFLYSYFTINMEIAELFYLQDTLAVFGKRCTLSCTYWEIMLNKPASSRFFNAPMFKLCYCISSFILSLVIGVSSVHVDLLFPTRLRCKDFASLLASSNQVSSRSHLKGLSQCRDEFQCNGLQEVKSHLRYLG